MRRLDVSPRTRPQLDKAFLGQSAKRSENYALVHAELGCKRSRALQFCSAGQTTDVQSANDAGAQRLGNLTSPDTVVSPTRSIGH
jgi:hypothetical protein